MGSLRSPNAYRPTEPDLVSGRAVLTPRALMRRLVVAAVLLVLSVSAGVLTGSYRLSLARALAQDGPDRQILMQVRIPRVSVAALVGAGLAGSGVVSQVLLGNPLADPYLLGVSSGAGLGAILAVLAGAGWSAWGMSGMGCGAFAGAMASLGLVWWISQAVEAFGPTGLVLAGVVVNAFLAALIMALVAIVRSDQVYATLFWLMGNVTEEGSAVVWLAAGVVCGCLVGLFLISSRLNVVSFGSEQARLMGIDVRRLYLLSFVLAGLMTSVAVSLAGLVGFVGLVVPHAVRLVVGADCRQLIPLSALVGGAFLIMCDTFSRIVVAPAQLPVGTVTALLGAPVFVVLLLGQARRVYVP